GSSPSTGSACTPSAPVSRHWARRGSSPMPAPHACRPRTRTRRGTRSRAASCSRTRAHRSPACSSRSSCPSRSPSRSSRRATTCCAAPPTDADAYCGADLGWSADDVVSWAEFHSPTLSAKALREDPRQEAVVWAAFGPRHIEGRTATVTVPERVRVYISRQSDVYSEELDRWLWLNEVIGSGWVTFDREEYRSEERRVGKECRARSAPDPSNS